MTPDVRRIGTHASPVLVIDDFSGDVGAIVETAAALAPFGRAEGNFYPGVRRLIGERDGAAWSYVTRTLDALAPLIHRVFSAERFYLLNASFSMVTDPPDSLSPIQRAPHFDSTDPGLLAVLHYISAPPDSGTAFYRQRSTGIERVHAGNVAQFAAAGQREREDLEGYTNGSNQHFEQVAAVEGVPDRLVVYQGSLLHSGVIPPDMSFSADPRQGRLTGNIFLKAIGRP